MENCYFCLSGFSAIIGAVIFLSLVFLICYYANQLFKTEGLLKREKELRKTAEYELQSAKFELYHKKITGGTEDVQVL